MEVKKKIFSMIVVHCPKLNEIEDYHYCYKCQYFKDENANSIICEYGE
jgi:hypothetical protein